MYTYNLPILPLTKAYALQLADSSCTIQKITYIVQLHLDMNGHQEELQAYITPLANYPIIFKINQLKQHNPTINQKKKEVTFNYKYYRETCLRHSPTTSIYSPGYQPKRPLISPPITSCCYINTITFYRITYRKD